MAIIHTKQFRTGVSCLAGIIALYLILSIPLPAPSLQPVAASSLARPFIWNQDDRWDALEAAFAEARASDTASLDRRIDSGLTAAASIIGEIGNREVTAGDPLFRSLEDRFFSLAPLFAAHSTRIREYLSLYSRLRGAIKRQSTNWDMNDRVVRETLYRLLYGGRTAVEEVLLQLPAGQEAGSLLDGTREPSATPAAILLGVEIHSGDILVSRGGAPTSALIARGNDFPGNFSHIALAHVDSSRRISIVESHIEQGATVSSPEEYLRDTKLRVMVLRLRADHPAMLRDPLLPHRAASAMLGRAHSRHIPYDFQMDYRDSSSLFCSEVASAAYGVAGVTLWTGMSHISSPGLRAWLADFGVKHFETQEPADLEYDPQLVVVAEWRDSETLRKDHIDNAVTEAMLEGAERGDRLGYDWWMLPIARTVKAYSSVLNLFDGVGPVPEGMSATSALKHGDYAKRHDAIATAVRARAAAFRLARGYAPPFWELVRMARVSREECAARP